MLNPSLDPDFTGKIDPPDTARPFGNARDALVENDPNATPLLAKKFNDDWGFAAAVATEAGITPSGDPDEAGNSQMLDGLKKIHGVYGTVASLAAGAHPVGAYVRVKDRNLGVFLVQSGGAADGKGILPAGGSNTAVYSPQNDSYDPAHVGGLAGLADITEYVQYLINLVGAQDPFAADPTGITIKFANKQKFNVLGKLLIPSYVRIDLNGSTLIGNNTTPMFETAYWDGTTLIPNISEPAETRFVVDSHVVNGRISNSLGLNFFNFCESSTVENIRGFGCNKMLYAKRCFYGSFQKMHSRSPVNGTLYPCYTFDSAMGALDVTQVFSVGYAQGYEIKGNKDNMRLENFGSESCPIGLQVSDATSGISFVRGYFENNVNAISLSSLANHERIDVDGCWFSGVTNAFEALTVLSGTFKENNILNGANVSLQSDFGCRMTVEIPTDVTADNATYTMPSNYLLGRANNVKYIKQVYDSVTGLVEAKCDIYSGPIPRNYAGTSGKPIADQIPFCTHVFTATTLTIDTKIEYQNMEFVGLQVSVNSVPCGGIALAGVMMSTIPSALVITPSDNGGFYRFVISGFTGGSTFGGSIKIL